MSATHDVPNTQIPATPGEIPPTPGVPGWFPNEPQTHANSEPEKGATGQDGQQDGAAGGLVETAKSYLPGEDDVQRALTNAGQAAKGWLPTSVAAYLPSSEEPSTTTSEANTTSALNTLAEAGSLDSAASHSTSPTTLPTQDAMRTSAHPSRSHSPPILPSLGVAESKFIEALPTPPISIPMRESPAPGASPSSLLTGAIEKTGAIAPTGSAALNSSRVEDNFPADTPQAFIDATGTAPPLPTPGPPPPPKDSNLADSAQGAAPPVPTKDAPSSLASSASASQSSSDDSGSGDDNPADGTPGKKKKRKLFQRLKQKLHVGHGHSDSHEHSHQAEAS
ncbi:hypothetical protein C8R47DRAFT_1078793 [Mycena vitilis]|nr:hypothetical protein C8R47DRAFT_1078793 [Mycena vitilis]